MRTLPLSCALFFLLLWSASMTQAQVSGKITVNKDFYDALKAQHGGSLLKTALQLEVWSVRYIDVLSDQNGAKTPITRIYLREKWSGASIPLTAEVAGSTVNLGNKGYYNPMGVINFYQTGEIPGQVLIHEITHVWQIHHSADIYFTLNSFKNQGEVLIERISGGDPQSVYQFDCTTGTPWEDFNLEQQAGIVEFCYFKRENPTTPFPTYCEEPLVVANIRNGLAFRTAACQQLIDELRLKRKAIQDRINALKVAWLIEQGETVVQNSDGTIKVGADKGIGQVSIPSSILDNDSQLNQLKAELAVLEQRQRDTNCY